MIQRIFEDLEENGYVTVSEIYEEIFNNFIDALVYLMPIEDIVGAESYDELNERLDK